VLTNHQHKQRQTKDHDPGQLVVEAIMRLKTVYLLNIYRL